MAGYTDLSASYSRTPIIVWVEDELTKHYLTEIWNDNDIGFLVAGSNEAVHAVVRDARDAELIHVFGIVDRDFGLSNVDKWMNTSSMVKVFRLPVLEIENYLLDAGLIAECSANFNRRTEDQIEQKLAAHARQMVCWLACRDVLSEYHDDIARDFPKHPKQNIQTLNDAEGYIRSQTWFKEIAVRVADLAIHLMNKLQAAEETRKAQLERGEWRREYAGKELFREVRGYVFQGGKGSHSQKDIALARSIATVQIEKSTIPAELRMLQTALKSRVGI